MRLLVAIELHTLMSQILLCQLASLCLQLLRIALYLKSDINIIMSLKYHSLAC